MTNASHHLFTNYVDRPFDHELREAALSGQHPFICLVGKEQIGKTTAAERSRELLRQQGHRVANCNMQMWLNLQDIMGDLDVFVQATPDGRKSYIFFDEVTGFFIGHEEFNTPTIHSTLQELAHFIATPERHQNKVIVVAATHSLPRWFIPLLRDLNPKTIVAHPYSSDDETAVSGFIERHWPDDAPNFFPHIVREAIDFFGSLSSECLDVTLARIACSPTPEEEWDVAKKEMLAPKFFISRQQSLIAHSAQGLYGVDSLKRPDVFEPDSHYALQKLAILTAIRDGNYVYKPEDAEPLLSLQIYGQIRQVAETQVAGTTNTPQYQIGNKVFEAYLNSPTGRGELEQRIHHHQRQLVAG